MMGAVVRTRMARVNPLKTIAVTFINALLVATTLLWSTQDVLAQSAALIPNAKQQFFNAQGEPLAGGSVYSYVPNTTTPKTTWVDPFESVPNAQPVTLDAGGGAFIFGQGNYRQIVKDANGNLIWDGFTSAYGSSQPSGANGTDTAPVGTIEPFAGAVLPTNWQFAAGQALSRSTFAQLLGVLTISATTGSCTSTSTTVSGFTSTAQIPVGSPIESSCLPTNTTVASIVSATTITVSQAATATGTFTVTDFPWGNGDGVTTFNVPDLRGRVVAGADCMNGSTQTGNCASRLTSTYYGHNAYTSAVAGGAQNTSATTSIAQANLPNLNFPVTGTTSGYTPLANSSLALGVPTGTVLVGGATGATSLYAAANFAAISGFSSLSVSGNAASGGSGTAATSGQFSVVQPTLTANYIIKVAPNTTGAGGVVSIGGMFGDILCGTGIVCSSQTISVASTAGTVSSVGLALPAIFNVSGSPITTTGTLTGTLANESANLVFAGPSSGSPAAPTFRALVSADVPPINLGSVGVNGGVTGTLGNAQLTNASLIANGTTCTLGASCTITTAASSVTVSGAGATTITGGSGAGFVISDNAGVLGETSSTTTINSVACVLGSTCSITASATSIAPGVTTISGGTNKALEYNNAGTLGEITTGNNEVLATNGTAVAAFTATLPSAVQTNITGTGTLTSGATGAGFTLALGTSTVTGQLATANGGTGVNAPTSGAIYMGAGSSPMAPSALSDNGTLVSSSEPLDLTSKSLVTEIANAGVTGTTVHKLAKLTGTGTALITAITDTKGAVGIVIGGAGTSSNAQIAIGGQASCVFDGATTANDYVQISSATAGDCADVGATYPTSGEVLGRVLTTNGAGGTYAMLVFPPEIVASAGSGGGVTSVNLIAGTGMSLGGTCNSTVAISCTINSPWSLSGSNIFNNNAGNVGIGTSSPSDVFQIGANIISASGFGLVVNSTTFGAAIQTNSTSPLGLYIGNGLNAASNNAIVVDNNVNTSHTNIFTMGWNGTLNLGTSAGSQSGQVCLNGGCITALSPPPCTPAANVGLSPSNSASTNSSAWSTWSSSISATSTGGCIQFAAGKYEFNSQATLSIPNNSRAGITIAGLGKNLTTLDWAAGGGLSLTLQNCGNTFSVANLSITTGAVNTGNGLLATNSASCPNGNQTFVSSDVTNVAIFGNDRTDSSAGTNYWANALHVIGVTYVNVNRDDFEGAQSHAGTGVLYESPGGTTLGTAMYVNNSNFYALGDGIIYGAFAQGLQVTSGSCVGVLVCIFAPSTETGLDALLVTSFDMSTVYDACVLTLSPITTVSISNSLCINFGGNNTAGFDLVGNAGVNISNNRVYNAVQTCGGSPCTNQVGIYLGASSNTPGDVQGTITGNGVWGWNTYPIQLDTGAVNTVVQSNACTGNGNSNHVLNSGSGNVVGSGNAAGVGGALPTCF